MNGTISRGLTLGQQRALAQNQSALGGFVPSGGLISAPISQAQIRADAATTYRIHNPTIKDELQSDIDDWLRDVEI